MNYLGIDLSKAYFDVTLMHEKGEKRHEQFENNRSGFGKLARWLKEQGVSQVYACMEATNVYWENLAHFLYEKGHKVSVVNPARPRGFATSQLRRSKTDKVDSDVIADFCKAHQPSAWKPPTPEQRQLRNLVRRRAALHKTLTQQKNRLTDCPDDEGKACWRRLITTLETEIEQVEQQIRDHIAQHPALRTTESLLRSIKGYGPIATWTLMAEMPDLADYKDAPAAAADAGATPAHHQSGDTIRRKSKLSKVGKASIRGVLYMPALTAIRFNPMIRAFAQRLEKQGKPKMVIIAAVIRKLIHLAYGVLKNKTPFDPNFGKSQATST